MKNKVFFPVMLVLFVVQIAQAQFTVGPRVGFSLSNVSTPDVIDLIAPDFKYLPGVEYGIQAEIPFADNFSVLSEIIYREKGFRVSGQSSLDLFNIDFPLGVRVDTRLRYIDVPLQLKYTVRSGPVSGYVSAGPQFGYGLNGRIKTRANFLTQWDVTNIPIKLGGKGHDRFEVSAVVGAGVQFDFGGGQFFADMRYTQGLADSFQVPVADLNIRNRAFGFGIGYRVPIK
ncbi:MAG: PorT family protein [Saprospiraceae bacterium]|nr:PorT family protein [Saprospiraceae bacterium]